MKLKVLDALLSRTELNLHAVLASERDFTHRVSVKNVL
jgi:hypothetical protein